MFPNGMVGLEYHHEYRVLYKSLTEHHDHLCKCIGSGGRLDRIVVVRAESIAASQSCHSSIAGSLFQRLVGGSRAARARLKDRPLVRKPIIDRILSLGRLVRYAHHRCVSLGLGVVFDSRSLP
jgi:hypothetical protein